MTSRALSVHFADPANVIDEATEVYGDVEIDDQGVAFKPCIVTGGSCEYLTECQVTRCVHCDRKVAR